ncbi:hypothetical protein GCM10009765_23700 [Fodinicola feengrottensis]|uniref:Uncharacterized protein n=1 Tax=Fodinicola feengrottensis TaxID=435914 RepID=A0ABP4SR81_9ACTN
MNAPEKWLHTANPHHCDHVSRDKDEYLVILTDHLHPRAFPAEIKTHPTNRICPFIALFRREVAERIVHWINYRHEEYGEPERAEWADDAILVTSSLDVQYEPHREPTRYLPGPAGRYALGDRHWDWTMIPEDSTSLQCGWSMPERRSTELPVTAFIHADGSDPAFPAIIGDISPSGMFYPGFRREVAEVIVDWINAEHQAHPHQVTTSLRWDGPSIVSIDRAANTVELFGSPEADDPRWIRTDSWLWELWDPRPRSRHTSSTRAGASSSVLIDLSPNCRRATDW